MLERHEFAKLVEEIKGQGIDHATACHYAAQIGDTPCFDEQGRLIVQDDDGKELARLKPLAFYDSGKPLILDGDGPALPPLSLFAKLKEKQLNRLLQDHDIPSDADRWQ